MATYRVIWEIDIEADSPKEAAESALEMQRDPESTATCFTVIGTQCADFSTDYYDLSEVTSHESDCKGIQQE